MSISMTEHHRLITPINLQFALDPLLLARGELQQRFKNLARLINHQLVIVMPSH